MKLSFTDEDIVKGLNIADLQEEGIFKADFIIIDDSNEEIEKIQAVGEWRPEGKEDFIPAILTVDSFFEIDNFPTCKDLANGKISPGQVFSLGWEYWTVEKR